MVMRGPGGDVSYLELPALPSAPFWARCHATAALHAWQLSSEFIETTLLIVSELVTNAIKAAGEPPAHPGDPGLARITLTVRLMPGQLIIEVSDSDQNPPVLIGADNDAESGRGLLLVDALSKEWGHFFPPAGGKTVFAILAA
jgi:anti-sigma regulatory factor (Ser/Thr protein kinase)